MPIFPNVPNVPGVPAVNRAPGSTFNNVVLLVSDAVSLIRAFSGPQWGIFQNGVQVVGQGVGDIISILTGTGSYSFLEMDFKQSFRIAQAPQELGAFLSYDKVQQPYNVACAVAAGGPPPNRSLLLSQVEAIQSSTGLFTLSTPDTIIVGLNPVGFSYRRRHDYGVGVLVIEMYFEQVRPAGNPTFSTTGVPGSTANAAPNTAVNSTPNATPERQSPATNGGQVSALAPSPSTSSAVAAGVQ